MTREEAAKDPKRNPKNDGQIIPKPGNRAKHTQKQHTTTTPKSRPNSDRETTPKSGKASEPATGKPETEPLPASRTPTERQKAPQMKKNPQSIKKAHSGPQMKPERATDPQPASIHGGNAARNRTKQPNGTSKAATATEQTHRRPATERKQQRPIKQPRKKKNGTTGQILNRPTEAGQTADGATGTLKIV